MRTFLWADTATERTRDDLTQVICTSRQRVSRNRDSETSHERLAWPERQLPPGGTAEDYQAARRTGARSFTLWRDPDSSREVFAHVETLEASPRGAEYEVRDDDGTRLAVIRREPASFWRLRRARWSVQQVDLEKRPPAVARKGRIVWWCLWIPFTPFSYTAFSDVDPPSRLRFRSGGRVVLDYRGTREDLEVLEEWWDPRVTTALLVLIHSWEAITRELTHRSFA